MENHTNSPYDSIPQPEDELIPIIPSNEPILDVSSLHPNTIDLLSQKTLPTVPSPILTHSSNILQNPLTTQETLLNDSRITPTGNGNPSSKPYCTQPTSAHKWWAAVLLGFIFALVSSPAAYYASSKITTSLGGITTMQGPGPNFVGLLIHTLIFIIIVRIILW